jgi:hypothetical protein
VILQFCSTERREVKMPFEQAWQNGGRPTIEDFLPREGPDRLAAYGARQMPCHSLMCSRRNLRFGGCLSFQITTF